MFTTYIPDIKLSQLDPQIQDWFNKVSYKQIW